MKPVAVSKEPTWRVIRRFNTIKEAEQWIDNLKSPRAIKDRHAGNYSIDAPEEML